MRIRNQASSLAALLLFCAIGWADTTSLPLTDDAWINANNPGANFGVTEYMFVHSWGPKQGLVRFDAAPIAGQSINTATLTLYLSSITNPGDVRVYAITSSWNESTVTWNNQPPVAATPVDTVAVVVSDQGSLISFDITDTVGRWADGSLADAGFLIDTGDSIKAYFDTKEMPGGIPAALEVETGETTFSGEAIVLDLTNPDDCVIDQPGYYVLDRTWTFYPIGDEYPNANCGIVTIASKDVTLDLRGFAFLSEFAPVLSISTGARFTLRNGTLDGGFVAIEDISGVDPGGRATLDRIYASGAVILRKRPVTVSGGKFAASLDPALWIGEDSRVERADLGCLEDACVSVGGRSVIRDCTIASSGFTPAISVRGDGTIVEGNNVARWIHISGNDNVIARNFSATGTYIEVSSGARNVVEGNIGLGIAFETTGNFYGNNRVALPGGFTGTAGNTDWGGNVSY